jgi:hypothetical protein
MDREFVAKLETEINDIECRVVEQTARLDGLAGAELLEETAFLRNLAMQLEGLKLMLNKMVQQVHGG